MIGSACQLLLAQVYRQDLGRGFRGAASQLRWTDVLPYIAAIVLLIAGCAVYSYLKRRNDMSERCNDPHKLFRELCLAHRLDRASRRLLLMLAEAAQCEQPAQVFLMPGAFEPAQLPASLRTRAADVVALRNRLF
ncbi:MAG TPA: hypothetical protein PKC18_05080 [Lacipirellulaceae bacterium]|nr:hypothetical protein [Lacipirellulaceae bacterium]HMP05025.1 hypothetical protein [Lacipirellulaceae bacterium]